MFFVITQNLRKIDNLNKCKTFFSNIYTFHLYMSYEFKVYSLAYSDGTGLVGLDKINLQKNSIKGKKK